MIILAIVWDNGVNINDNNNNELLTNVPFADDIMLIAETTTHSLAMVTQLKNWCSVHGLNIIYMKTKFIGFGDTPHVCIKEDSD